MGGAHAGGPWATVGRQVDVSRAPGRQAEVAIAADPRDSSVLIAGSNSVFRIGGMMRAYSSMDGGATWASTEGPPLPHGLKRLCTNDPAVAVDLPDREYFAFIGLTCDGSGLQRLFVATRPGPYAEWRTRAAPIAPLRGASFDDKPALAADTSSGSPHLGRVYLGWTRDSPLGATVIVLSHSDDGGAAWSSPVQVSDEVGSLVAYATVAVASDGTVYVAWQDVGRGAILVDRSSDGGATFGIDRLPASLRSTQSPGCQPFGTSIPAQPRRCIRPNPDLTVASSGPGGPRVYLSFGHEGAIGTQDVFVTVFDRRLRPIALRRRGFDALDRRVAADRFWPAAAVDPVTGRLWVCFCDTSGDPSRRRAIYSCTVSRDGGKTWLPPIHAASVASDETQPGANRNEYGDYEGLAVAGGVAHPIWTDSRDLATLGEEIYTTALSLRCGLCEPASGRRRPMLPGGRLSERSSASTTLNT